MGSANLKHAVERINASTAKLQVIETKVAGYAFIGGSHGSTEQNKAFVKKLDEIHALTLKIKGGR